MNALGDFWWYGLKAFKKVPKELQLISMILLTLNSILNSVCIYAFRISLQEAKNQSRGYLITIYSV